MKYCGKEYTDSYGETIICGMFHKDNDGLHIVTCEECGEK